MKTQKLKVAALALVLVMPSLASAMGEFTRQKPESGDQTQCWKQEKAQAEAQDRANRQSTDSSGNDSHSGSAG
jgi:hypothetical protein